MQVAPTRLEVRRAIRITSVVNNGGYSLTRCLPRRATTNASLATTRGSACSSAMSFESGTNQRRLARCVSSLNQKNEGTTKEQRRNNERFGTAGVQPLLVCPTSHGSVDEVASPERLERAILDFGAKCARPTAVSASLYLLPMVFANSSPSVLGKVLNTMGSATLGSWNAACTCNNFKPREKPTLDFHAKFVRT